MRTHQCPYCGDEVTINDGHRCDRHRGCTQRMDPRVRKLWADALLSGEFPQGEMVLRDSSGRYCCLGVLCELHRRETGEQWLDLRYLGTDTRLPEEVMHWAGLTSDDPYVQIEDRSCALSEHNDGAETPRREPATFEQIAKAIEEQL